jgi:hypothetical protein
MDDPRGPANWDDGRTEPTAPTWMRWAIFAAVVLYALLAFLWLLP